MDSLNKKTELSIFKNSIDFNFIMSQCRLFLLLFSLVLCGCHQSSKTTIEANQIDTPTSLSSLDTNEITHRGALLLTRFQSLKDLKKVIQIEYFKPQSIFKMHTPQVQVTHTCAGRKVKSILKSGVSEYDIRDAWFGSIWDQVFLGLKTPYLIINKTNFPRIYNLSRRKSQIFGEGDVAFYDLAETMVKHIHDDDLAHMSERDLSEKGYLNSFNHITSQAFMTSIFSERFADFIADLHERAHMPELITGEFTEEQMTNWGKGPIDNYVDIINNEWGQELGKRLKKKYNIKKSTFWTPDLLADYLNDIQRYYSWAFQIGFKPFKASDQLVVSFSNKLNIVMEDTTGLRFKKKK